MIFHSFNNCLYLFLICLVDYTLSYYTERNISEYERLLNDIFDRNSYFTLVRPFTSNVIRVDTELKLLQIDLNEKEQKLMSNVWFEMKWYDERLMWNPEDYGGIKEITIPNDEIWIPDISLQNGIGQNNYLFEFKYFNPWILNDGLVTWVPEVKLYTRCLIKIRDFPFDIQCCEINFYSWAHSVSQMEVMLFKNQNYTNLTHLAYNSEWQITYTCALNKTITTGSNLDWWVASYIIFMKRNSAYYVYTLFMPCFVLGMLSLLLFWLPSDSGEKVTLGITLLLSFFFNSFLLLEYTPEGSSELPVIGIYYAFNIIHITISMLISVLASKLLYLDHVPNLWCEWIPFCNTFKRDNLGRIVRLNYSKDSYELYRHLKNDISNSFDSCIDLNIIKENDKKYLFTHQLLQLAEYQFKQFIQKRFIKKSNQRKLIEWKKFVKKLDYLSRIISFISLLLAPLFVFAKFIKRDYFGYQDESIYKCGCGL